MGTEIQPGMHVATDDKNARDGGVVAAGNPDYKGKIRRIAPTCTSYD